MLRQEGGFAEAVKKGLWRGQVQLQVGPPEAEAARPLHVTTRIETWELGKVRREGRTYL